MSKGAVPEPRQVSSDFPLFFLESVESTNTFMKEWVRSSSLRQGTVLYAGTQTAGRGRPGNRWLHFPGNLAMSLWVSTEKTGEEIPWTLKAAFVLLELLSDLGVPCVLKYPNDIWLEDPPRKIAGILVEQVNRGAVIGLGVNRRTPPGMEHFGACEALPGMHQLALGYGKRFFRTFLSNGSASVSQAAILERLNGALLWKGRWVAWKGQNGPLVGKINRLGKTGQLEVATSDGKDILLPETVRSLELLEPFHG